MTRKIVVISSLIVIAIVAIAMIWRRSAQGSGVNTSAEAQAVRETILRARRIQLEAEYTFDTSQYATVYINDPRGGEMPDEALDQIQLIRQDPTLRKDQVGFLDSAISAIESLKGSYDNWMKDLRAREAAGTLDEVDQLILEGEMYGWPTPAPEDESAAAIATQACEVLILSQAARWETEAAYPAPKGDPRQAYPEPEQFICPTPNPTPHPLKASYRGSDPATLPPEEFEMDIYSIEVEGDVAKAVIHKGPVTSEYVLVKVDGQWYIAGAKLLKYTP